MKQRGVFLIGLILIAVYYFLFPRNSGKELVVSPESLTEFRHLDSASSTPSLSPVVVQSGENVGYLDGDFKLQSFFTAERIAADKDWVAARGEGGLSIMEPDGRLIARIPEFDYPVARHGNLFLYRDSTGVLSKINPQDGRVLWRREYISTVTVLDGRPGKTLVGLLDGRVELIDDSGNVILKYRPGGSRVEAVYGGALSRDGSMIALISGLDPQRFVLLEERKNGYRPVAHHDTGTDFRHSVFVDFARDGRQVVYENSGYADAVNLNGYGVNALNLSGRLVGSIDNPAENTLLLFGRDDDNAEMKLLSRCDLPVFESGLSPETSEIVKDGRFVLLVDPESIAALEFSVE